MIVSETRASIGGGKRLDPRDVFMREKRVDHALEIERGEPDAEDDESTLAAFTAQANNIGKS